MKFYYPEKESDEIEAAFLKSDQIYISNLSIVEMASALMKKVRNRELAKTKEMLIWNTLLDDLQTRQMEVITLDDRHYLKASDIIREFGNRYGIKTLDALQLSVAQGMDNTKLLCTDKALSKTAAMMGVQLVRIS